MSELSRDLITRFTSLGLGVFGTSIFLGPKPGPPSQVGDNGPYIQIGATGGAGAKWIKNEDAPSRYQPTCQITITALSYSIAETKARAVHAACFARNISIGGTKYESLDAVGEPMEFPLDGKERMVFKFNVRAVKAP